MASTSLEDMARTCSQAPPKQVLRGHFAPRWRSLLQTTLSSLPAAPSPLELAQVLKQPSIRTFLAPPGQTTPPRRRPTSRPTPCVHAPIRVVIRPTRGARTRRPPKRRRLEPAPLQPLAPALGRHHQREGALISRIISRHEDRHKAQLHGHSTSADTVFLVEWGPERCTHQSLTKLQQQGFRTVSLRILDEFDDFATVDEKELDPPCVSCAKGGGGLYGPGSVSVRTVPTMDSQPLLAHPSRHHRYHDHQRMDMSYLRPPFHRGTLPQPVVPRTARPIPP